MGGNSDGSHGPLGTGKDVKAGLVGSRCPEGKVQLNNPPPFIHCYANWGFSATKEFTPVTCACDMDDSQGHTDINGVSDAGFL